MSSSIPALRVDLVPEGTDTLVVHLGGELDIATGPTLRARLAEVSERRSPRLVFDLRDLEFTDVVGIGVLLELEAQAAAQGGGVVLRHAAPLVRRMITLLDLQDRLVVAD